MAIDKAKFGGIFTANAVIRNILFMAAATAAVFAAFGIAKQTHKKHLS